MNISLRTICLPVILLANVVLPACGGGGGGTPAVPSGPAAPTYTIGGTASGLAASTSVVLQNNGGDNLTVSAVGAYTFGTALNTGAAYAVTVLTQPAGQSCSVVTGGSGTVSGTNITTIVVSCVNLPASGKAWGAAASITGSNEMRASTLRVAVDASGNAMAVWEKVRITNLANDVWYSRYTVGLGWSAPAVIPRLFVDDPASGPTENSRNPDVAMDVSGNAIAVWRQPSGIYEGVFYIWSSRYTVGSDWGSRELIGISGVANSRDPKIAIDASGNAVAVWRHDDNDGAGIPGIQYNRYTAGSGWALPATSTLIGGLGTGSQAPVQLAMNASGNAVVVWSQGVPSPVPGSGFLRFDVWSSRYTATANTWSEPELIETDDAGEAEFPEIAIDASGNAVAAWHQFDGQNYNILANRYTVGTGWGTAVPIATGNTGAGNNAVRPKIAIDASGNAMVMWRQYYSAYISGYLFFNRYTVGTGWGTPVVIGDAINPICTCGHPAAIGADPDISNISGDAYRIAVNASGDTVAVWVAGGVVEGEDPADPATLSSSRYTVDTGWSWPDYIQDGYDPVQHAEVVIDPNGNTLAVWVEKPYLLPSVNHIKFNRYE